MEAVIPVPAAPTLPVEGTTQVFPVRRIYCIGRNYADHAREWAWIPSVSPPSSSASSTTRWFRLPAPHIEPPP